jgi:hypothetical protein
MEMNSDKEIDSYKNSILVALKELLISKNSDNRDIYNLCNNYIASLHNYINSKTEPKYDNLRNVFSEAINNTYLQEKTIDIKRELIIINDKIGELESINSSLEEKQAPLVSEKINACITHMQGTTQMMININEQHNKKIREENTSTVGMLDKYIGNKGLQHPKMNGMLTKFEITETTTTYPSTTKQRIANIEDILNSIKEQNKNAFEKFCDIFSCFSSNSVAPQSNTTIEDVKNVMKNGSIYELSREQYNSMKQYKNNDIEFNDEKYTVSLKENKERQVIAVERM